MKDINKNHVASRTAKILNEINKVEAVAGVVDKTGALGKDGMIGSIVAEEVIKSGLLKRLLIWLAFWR